MEDTNNETHRQTETDGGEGLMKRTVKRNGWRGTRARETTEGEKKVDTR